MSYGQEFSEGDKSLKASGFMPPMGMAADQWQNVATLNKPDAGMITAQRSIDQLFGVPAITGNDGMIYLQAHISNVPEVSQGIQNLDDLKALGTGVAKGLQRFGQESLNYMSKPNAVTDSLLQIGPVLDNAVNYYANTSADQVGRDAQAALGYAAEALENTLGYPLKPQQRGEQAGTLMPVFFLEGMKEPLRTEAAQQMGLTSMSEDELGKLGIRRAGQETGDLHMPEVPEHLRYLELQPASDELLTGIRNKGREIVFAAPDSEEMDYLKFIKAEANTGGTNLDHILLKDSPTKIAALEEFLHGTQSKLGLFARDMPGAIGEVRVKDFMLRHRDMLGLTNNDVTVLEALKQTEIDKALRAGYTPYEIGEKQW